MWTTLLIDFVVKLILGIFGTDKPHETNIIETVPEVDLPSDSDDDLLDECGL